MNYIKLVLIIFGLFVVNLLPAQDALNKYLENAAINNPGLQAEFNEYMAALEIVPQVKALPDPQFAFAYFIKPSSFSSAFHGFCFSFFCFSTLF